MSFLVGRYACCVVMCVCVIVFFTLNSLSHVGELGIGRMEFLQVLILKQRILYIGRYLNG